MSYLLTHTLHSLCYTLYSLGYSIHMPGKCMQREQSRIGILIRLIKSSCILFPQPVDSLSIRKDDTQDYPMV